MSGKEPKIQPWQSTKTTREAAEIGFDILRTLAHAKEPLTPTEIRQSVRPGSSMIGRTDGLVQNVLRIQHKAGVIQSTSRVNRLTLVLDRPRFTITEAGLDVLSERRSRSAAVRRATSRKKRRRRS